MASRRRRQQWQRQWAVEDLVQCMIYWDSEKYFEGPCNTHSFATLKQEMGLLGKSVEPQPAAC